MKGEVVCFLPCRSGSERVRNKNIKPETNSPLRIVSTLFAAPAQTIFS